MSHTTSIDSIVFSDMKALAAAVSELNSRGVKCSLVKDAVPRAYFPNQKGMEKAPYVLTLEGCRFDVGFYPASKGKGYVARTDLFNNHVSDVLGAKSQGAETAMQAALGKLNSTYAVHAATMEAQRKGHTVRRVNNADGSIRLVVSNFN